MGAQRLLGVVLVLSVAARIAVALYLGDTEKAPPLLMDQLSYHALGQRIVEGKGYSFAQGWYPFTMPDTPTAHWSFAYPLFVAALYSLFGVHPLAVRLVQSILGGLLLPWLVYRLARRAVSERPRIALIAAGVAAVYGYFVLYAAALMTETFFIALLLWAMEASLRVEAALREGRVPPVVPVLEIGLSLGLATLMRQSILPWAPVLFLWLLWRARRVGPLRAVACRFALAGVIICALIAPWTYRNYRVYGEFLLLNSSTGYAMYSAQHPMHGMSFSEFAAAPTPPDLEGMNEAQMDRELLRRGIQLVLDDPGRYALLSLSRLRAYMEFWPTPDTTLLHNIGRVGSFGLMLPFLVYGLWLALRQRELAQRNSLILVFACFYSIMHILTWAMVRYRLPVDAVLLPFTALGLEGAHAWLRRSLGSRARRREPAGLQGSVSERSVTE